MMYIFRYFGIYYQKSILVLLSSEGRGEGGGHNRSFHCEYFVK